MRFLSLFEHLSNPCPCSFLWVLFLRLPRVESQPCHGPFQWPSCFCLHTCCDGVLTTYWAAPCVTCHSHHQDAL